MEPFSAAGTAVGIVSLGVQVCQGLLSYYSGWKDFGEDVKATTDSIADLRRILLVLEDILSRSSQSDIVRSTESAEKCLQMCGEGVRRLEKKLANFNSRAVPSGFRQIAIAELKRAAYPLKSSTLVKLRETVEDLTDHLSLALQVLQLDSDETFRNTLRHISGQVISVAASTAKVDRATEDIAVRSASIAKDLEYVVTAQQAAQLPRILGWLSAPDPYLNHTAARQRHEPGTGTWFLRSSEYQEWKSGQGRRLWLYGKAGCCKTVLRSTIIEDIQVTCDKDASSALGFFYFAFNDLRKQDYASLLATVVNHLCKDKPVRPWLQQAYDKWRTCRPPEDVLERLVVSAAREFKSAVIVIDALDECPEPHRQSVFNGLSRLHERCDSLSMPITSRKEPDIHETMQSWLATSVQIVDSLVNTDIRYYVERELSRHRVLSKVTQSVKREIETTFEEKAGGMFRWAFGQLEELKHLKSTKLKYITAKLNSLPATLYKTYERMLDEIDPVYKDEALRVLKWLAFSRMPLTLQEVEEVCITDPQSMPYVDEENRGSPGDIVEIISSLVAVETKGEGEQSCAGARVFQGSDILRLAHFSVFEYLTSDAIRDSRLSRSPLRRQDCHYDIAQGCVAYILHYGNSPRKQSPAHDSATFPLLWFARRQWPRHLAYGARRGRDGLESRLLLTGQYSRDWVLTGWLPNGSVFNKMWQEDSAFRNHWISSLDALRNVQLDIGSSGHWRSSSRQVAAMDGEQKVATRPRLLVASGSNDCYLRWIDRLSSDSLREYVRQAWWCCDGCASQHTDGHERFRCLVCEDFDFCNNCFSDVRIRDKHQHSKDRFIDLNWETGEMLDDSSARELLRPNDMMRPCLMRGLGI